MRRTNFQTFGQALDDFFKSSGFEQKIFEIKIRENWKTIVGPVFSKSAKRIVVNKQILYITIDSPIIKQELNYNKSIVLRKLNESIGSNFLQEIIIR